MIITSAPQRTRILFAWAFPFAYLINFTLMLNSQWTPLVTPHLIGDTLIIFMANSGENSILITVMIILIVFDVLASMAIVDSLVSKAIFVQIALTLGGIFIFFGASTVVEKQESTRDFENAESTLPITKRENLLTNRKSKKLHF